MRRLLLALAVALTFAGQAEAQQNSKCGFDQAALLSLDERQFDQSPAGWRGIARVQECEITAADLLALYRQQHPGAVDQIGLIHHEAQLRAANKQTEAALALLAQVRARETTAEMKANRDAEIAFLRKDRQALLDARSRLASIPEPSTFAASVARSRAMFPNAPVPTWPLNIDVIDGFIACFDKSYREAYGTSCRPHRAP